MSGAWLREAILALALATGLVSPGQASEARPAPGYSARRLGGEEAASLASLRGKVVLLNTFATWCAPCRAEMPDFEVFYRRYRDRGLEVVGVNVDEGEADERVTRFVEKTGISFAIWRDPRNLFSKRFRVLGVPETLLIDRDGMILRHWNGPMDPGDPETLAVIEGALGQNGARPVASRPDERSASVLRGRRLAAQRGCFSCHATDGGTGAGPAWTHLLGSEVTLDDGRRIPRDRAYLARAIRDPDAEIVAGYEKGIMAGAMPGGRLTDGDVEALVLYLESL